MSLPTKILIMVASHKSYDFPADIGYLPVHVGKELNPNDLGFKGDETGDNISIKNKSFCELTAIYWAWKNINADFIGLAHYRRYFKQIENSDVLVKGKSIASSKDILRLLSDFDVLVSKKRCYFIDTVSSHYKNAHYFSDLKAVEKIILEKYPEYVPSYHSVVSGHCLHLYNMFVMSKENFDAYSSWLFDILFELERKITIDEYGPYQGRVFGFLSERLLNVWLHKNKSRLKIKSLSVVSIEGENLLFKFFGLLRRKLLKYKMD